MHLIDYLNPFSSHFHACKDFCNQLTLNQKIKTLAVTILFTPFIILGGVAAFRLMVEKYIIKKSNDSPLKPFKGESDSVSQQAQMPIIEVSETVTSPAPVERIPLRKQNRSVSLSSLQKNQLAQLSPEELKQYVRTLNSNLLEAFWKQESEMACQASNRQDIENSSRRLSAIFESISDGQFEESVQFNFFWSILSRKELKAAIAKELTPLHYSVLAKRAKDSLEEVEKSGEDIVSCMGSLISLIPEDDRLPACLEGICKNAVLAWERILKGLIRKAGNNNKTLLESLNQSIKNSRKSLPPSPVKKLTPSENRSRRWSSPANLQPAAITFTESKPYQTALAKEDAEKLLQADSTPLQEDLFFWSLENLHEPLLEKKKQFVLNFFLDHVNPQEYLRLEKMTEVSLSHLVKTLDTKSLELFWNQEKSALGSYKERREIKRLKKRLVIEFKALTETQFKESMNLNSFWVMITGREYKKTVAQILSPEQFGWLAEFINGSRDIDQINALADLMPLIPKEEEEDLHERKALAILPYVTNIPGLLDKLIFMKKDKWVKEKTAKIQKDRELSLLLESVTSQLSILENRINEAEKAAVHISGPT